MLLPNGLYATLVGACAVALIAFLIAQARIFSDMRERFVEEWNELGRPTVFLNASLYNTFTFLGFWLGGRYLELGDAELNGRFRTLWLITAILAVLAIVLLFARRA